ncbi:MAG: 3'-5' exonuclease [Saprospiraceae bacterium]|nr:3'-5' exonuclease [Saprospiraceae bacterium]
MFNFLFRWKKYPEFWQEYLRHFDHSWSKKTPIEEVRFVVVDTETTGLDPSKDKLLSIAAAAVVNRQLLLEDSFECYVAQHVNTGGNAPVHGILQKEMEQGLTEAEALRQFLAFCKDAVIVGHHIGFDKAMLNQALKNAGAGKLKNKFVDTARLAVRVEHPFERYNVVYLPGEFGLDALSKRFNIPDQERHTAAGDVYITAILFLKLLARVQKRGNRTLGELLSYDG